MMMLDGNVPAEMRAMLAEIERTKKAGGAASSSSSEDAPLSLAAQVAEAGKLKALNNRANAFLEELEDELDDERQSRPSISASSRADSFSAWLGGFGLRGMSFMTGGSTKGAPEPAPQAAATAPRARGASGSAPEEPDVEIDIHPMWSFATVKGKQKQATREAKEAKKVAAAKARQLAEEQAEADRIAAAKAKEAAELEAWRQAAAAAKAKQAAEVEAWKASAQAAKHGHVDVS
jgi:hypothetical protein